MDVVLFVHILAAMAWVGGAFLVGTLSSRLKAADPRHRLGFARAMQGISMKVFMPGAVLVLAMGVWMVLDSEIYEFEQAWIALAIAVVVITGAMGPLFFKPTIDRGVAAMEAGDPAAARAQMRRLGMGSKFALVLQFIALWAMVAKPGL